MPLQIRHSTSTPLPHHRLGFSMMELVVTMMIMAVMAGVAVPRIMSHLSDYRAAAAAKRIASDLRLAQKHARTTGSSETVTFDATNSQYSFSSILDPVSVNTNYSVDISAGPYAAQISSVDFDGSPSVTFNGLGLPGAAGTLQLSSGLASRAVEIEAASGTVTVRED